MSNYSKLHSLSNTILTKLLKGILEPRPNLYELLHIVATRNICPGEVIAVEKPYSLILAKENVQTHCSNCLSACWAIIPCNYCTYAMYCSEECRNIEWKKCHDIECAVFPALMEYDVKHQDLFSIRLAVLALREAGGIKELRTMLKEVDECNDGKLYSDRYIGIYSLVANTKKRNFSELFCVSVEASVMLFFLATCTDIFGAKLEPDLIALANNNDVTFFGGLILRHQQIISCNTHVFNEMRGVQHVERGIAAMPFFSLINHSCDPNTFRHSRPNHIVMYAIRPIRKGEQLFDDYGRHYAITPRLVRQDLLKPYCFNCDCIPCREDWPLFKELKTYETLVKKPEDKAKIREALSKFNIYVELLTVGTVQDTDMSSIIKDLLKMVQILHDCAPMPCREMNNVIEMLKTIYNLNGNVNMRYHKYENNALRSTVRAMFSL